MHPTTLAIPLSALLLLAAAPDPSETKPVTAPAPAAAAEGAKEPDHITIQHVLIGFTGSVPRKNITRTQEEAKKLAEEILARAKQGESFDELVKKYTDDAAPGIYSMANNGVAPAAGEYARGRMVPAFGDAGFPLQVGEIGMAPYDSAKSPYGWHIVKRLK
jgi:foldase protein PrsA